MLSLIAFLAAWSAGTSHRCGLEALAQQEALSGTAAGIVARDRSIRSNVAVNTSGTKLLRTAHFAVWYKTNSDSDALSKSLSSVPASDSVPAIVRAVGTALEQARSFYLDTLGMLEPLPSSQSGVIAETAPDGLYPVEFCRPERALSSAYWGSTYYGLTLPQGTSSRIFLSAKLLEQGWSYALETGGTINTQYADVDSWIAAMRATAAHELFHAVQFRYESSLGHFLFEASAVAMEDAVLPTVEDHLGFIAQLYGYNVSGSSSTVPLLQANFSDAYRHALYVMGVLQDAGRPALRKLWEDRATRSNSGRSTILGTLRDVLPASGIELRESMIRYAQRVAVAGKRRAWTVRWDTIPAYSPWDRAALAPPLDRIATKPSTGENNWTLGAGEFRILTDPAIAGDLRVTWHPSGGAFLARFDSVASGFVRETFPAGVTTIPSARRRASLWVVGSDGTDPSSPTATGYVSAAASLSFRQSSPTVPATDSCHLRVAFPDSSGDSIVLEGCPTTTAASYEIDAIANGRMLADAVTDSLARHGTTVLLSSSPALALRNATLSIPGRWKYAYERRDAGWKRVKLRSTGTRTIVSWNDLAIGDSQALLLTSQSTSTAPFPNPSLEGQPVVFPLGVDLEGLSLTILAADGSLVRQWGPTELSFNTVWDLRNLYGYRVRPGVYTWVLSGSRFERGRLLVGR